MLHSRVFIHLRRSACLTADVKYYLIHFCFYEIFVTRVPFSICLLLRFIELCCVVFVWRISGLTKISSHQF